ncbi:hypothetical protein, partial [Streptomyces sp. NPDC048577]|uniref:hypothetical protein n=1 Tax=Streptomyces sp. NPDC048577 TaxID=3157209 RepID=UPI003414FE00
DFEGPSFISRTAPIQETALQATSFLVQDTSNQSHLCSPARVASEFNVLIEQAASKRAAGIVKNHNEQRCSAHWQFLPS